MDLSPPIFDGVVHAAYANPRPEVAALVPGSARRILDLGCSTGHLGAALLTDPAGPAHREVIGVEMDPTLASEARQRLSGVVEADLERLPSGPVPVELAAPFDCVIAADVLEHLRDPWSVVSWAAERLTPAGSLVISVPNIRHLRTFWLLLVKHRWAYEPVGIFDRTHLRWFARGNLPELLEGTGLEVAELTRTYQLVSRWESRINRLAPAFGELGTLQFVFRAERPTTTRNP
jgi:2-polyprenyl-3-methyl-5-hydroxy-6-metoxy-1,4-benzoquinol methylase